jgi:hypothetical protein
MTNQELLDLQEKLDEIARLAEDVSALAHDKAATATRFRSIARYVRSVSTCVRLYGQIPVGKDPDPAHQLLTQIQQLTSLIPKTVNSVRRATR